MSFQFHTLRQEQGIPCPIDQVFAFFADAYNLEQITPPWLHFRILSMNPGLIAQGTEIRYRLDVRAIFHYRRQKIDELFAACPHL